MMGGTWRLARSLGRLRTQINDRFPGRSKIADGTIGDAAHRARGAASDHNPHIRLGNMGIVTALDLTHDPGKRVDTYAMAEHLRLVRDPRIKFVVSRRQIFSSTREPWVWRQYYQTPHTGHVHISVSATAALFDDNRDWNIDFDWSAEWGDASPDAQRDVLRRGSTGEDVRIVQQFLSIGIDGIFGPATERAVREFQASVGIRVDGIIGPRTWEHLEFLEVAPE